MRQLKLHTGDRKVAASAKFISFEGIDGCGKSTLLNQFCSWLSDAAIPYIKTREPGGTRLGESIRDLLLDPSNQNMDEWAEVLLYTASRAQLLQEVIRPALQQGTWVVADRFIDATLAYQGYGRGLDLERLRKIQQWACKGLLPDHTALLDCDVETAFSRMQGRTEDPDRMELEKLSFHQRVREGYLELAKIDSRRLVVLNTEKPLHEVIEDLYRAFWQPLLQNMP